MNSVINLENAGYKLHLAIDYAAPNKIPHNANALLSDLTDNKPQAALYLAERDAQPPNRMTAERTKADIVKGIIAGECIYSLFNRAVECIANMTGEKLFYEQNSANIKAIYGVGLLEQAPLENELADVRKRLSMLTRDELSIEPTDSRKRIDKAIKAHREREVELLKIIDNGE